MADPAQFLTALFTAGMSANGNANGHGAQQVPQQVPHQQAVQYMHQQMPNMGFPGFPGMQHPMFNQQNSGAGLMSVLTEALRLSSPIGSSPNDEEILVQTLYESESRGLTYRAALEGLQGVSDSPSDREFGGTYAYRIDKQSFRQHMEGLLPGSQDTTRQAHRGTARRRFRQRERKTRRGQVSFPSPSKAQRPTSRIRRTRTP